MQRLTLSREPQSPQQTMRMRFILRSDWPFLAWVAKIAKGSKEIQLIHGPHVETAPEWACEAAWAGAYRDGGFDLTDLVSGTGVRIRGGQAVFVSSSSTVDRLTSCETSGHFYVSNSLVALTALLDVTVDPLYEWFYEDFRTIVEGVDKYKTSIETSRPSVRLTYFRNLVCDGRTLAVCNKPCGERIFKSFDDYRGFLAESLTSIGGNMADAGRKYRYTPLGTLSTGYDSPTVAVLSRLIGNTDVLTFRHGRSGLADDGTEIANRLGLKSIVLDRNDWRQRPSAEIPFIAANAYGEEVHYCAAASHLTGRLLLTGYHGDKVWDTSTHDLSPMIKRGDPSGLGLTESRLWMGFLHCPLPFFGVRNIEQIYRISVSREMDPWRVGGDYDRPICRRIVETEGIPRHLFGTQKSAASVVLWDRNEGFLPPASMKEYAGWLRRHRIQWLKKHQLPPTWALRLRLLKAAVGRAVGKNPEALAPSDYLFRHLFPWAMETARKRYGNTADLRS